MIAVLFIGVAMIAAMALWLVRRKAPSRKAMFERYGVSYFKVLLRQRGVDLSNIPDAELAKIVRAKIQAAKRQATITDLAGKRFLGSNWKITLVKSLEAEANRMCSVEINRHRNATISDPTQISGSPRTSEANEVRKGMTLDQFVEATKRGELYSKLSERQIEPPKSLKDQ